MTIQFQSLSNPRPQSLTLRSILALFDATGDEVALCQNLARLMVARAIVAGRVGQ